MKNILFLLFVASAVTANAQIISGPYRADVFVGAMPNTRFQYNETYDVTVFGLSFGAGMQTNRTNRNVGIGFDGGVELSGMTTRRNQFADNPAGWQIGGYLKAGIFFGPFMLYAKGAYIAPFWRSNRTILVDPWCGCRQTVSVIQPISPDPYFVFGPGVEVAIDRVRIGADFTMPTNYQADVVRPYMVRFYIGAVFGEESYY